LQECWFFCVVRNLKKSGKDWSGRIFFDNATRLSCLFCFSWGAFGIKLWHMLHESLRARAVTLSLGGSSRGFDSSTYSTELNSASSPSLLLQMAFDVRIPIYHLYLTYSCAIWRSLSSDDSTGTCVHPPCFPRRSLSVPSQLEVLDCTHQEHAGVSISPEDSETGFHRSRYL
jgi:hypothetical protein